jgi:hypothetical protein
MEERPVHSPLGASGAERWMNCPGSVGLLKNLSLPETDEPEYSKEGTAGHEAGAHCLTFGTDGWELVGQKFYDTEINVEIADAVQVYLDVVRPLMVPHATVLIEERIQFEDHPQGYGTVDCGIIADSLLNVVDLKLGKGVPVEVEDNPQLKYYAYGILEKHPDVRRVVFRIVQPRCFHPDGPVRRWEASAEDIVEWAQRELIPAMNRTEIDNDLDAGKWCRFCPAKLVCPLMTGLFGQAMKTDKSKVVELTDAEIGRTYQYVEAVKQYLKALEEETYRRLNLGHVVPGTKLVYKKANRVYRSGAEEFFKEKYGELAYTKPELRSPAAMEEVAGDAPKLVKEWAYTPQTGLTVALERDKRPAVKVQSSTEAFGEAVAALDMPQAAE